MTDGNLIAGIYVAAVVVALLALGSRAAQQSQESWVDPYAFLGAIWFALAMIIVAVGLSGYLIVTGLELEIVVVE